MPIELEKLSFANEKNKKYAADLFSSKGFCIVKKFLDKESIEYFRKTYGNGDNLYEIGSRKDNSYHHFLAKYFYLHKPGQDPAVMKITKNASKIRNEIALQINSDRFMQDYCQRKSIDPESMERLIDSQMSHSFVRIALYRHGEGQVPHYDNPSELQAIVYLSTKVKDYISGGLVLCDVSNNEEVDVDSIVEEGDLVILNSYTKKHLVKPVECKEGQIGRLHIFIPIIPDYLFGGKSYHFEENPTRLIFTTHVGRIEKVRTYTYHYISLIKKTNMPIDRKSRY